MPLGWYIADKKLSKLHHFLACIKKESVIKKKYWNNLMIKVFCEGLYPAIISCYSRCLQNVYNMCL